jgi:hypothetical protein
MSRFSIPKAAVSWQTNESQFEDSALLALNPIKGSLCL